MPGLNDWKRKRVKAPDLPKPFERTVKRQLAAAAGTEALVSKNPVWHIGESFRQSFDFAGRRNAEQLGAMTDDSRTGERLGREPDGMESVTADGRGEEPEQSTRMEGILDETNMDRLYEPNPGAEKGFAKRFSETAFHRGTMSGALMRGSGQMMLLSCLKRSTGQSGPKNFRQRKLFQSGASQKLTVPGRAGDKAVVNRGESDGAVAIVVDALRSAREITASLSTMEKGSPGALKNSGSDTLFKMYPFLDDCKERELLAKYGEMLQAEQSGERKRILRFAMDRANAQIEAKSRKRFEFTRRLSKISEQAEQASEIFESEEFRAELAQRLADYSPDIPPEDGDSQDDGNDVSDASQA